MLDEMVLMRGAVFEGGAYMKKEKESKLFNSMMERLREYSSAIADVGFAAPERVMLSKLPETEEELIGMIGNIMDFNKELNLICDESNTSMYVCDGEGKTIRINKAFEPMVLMHRENLFGRNVQDLEEEGIFKPSVCALALREKRTVAVIQEIGDIKGMAVTGVPIFDENGRLFRAVTNALLLDYIESMTKYFKDEPSGNEPISREHIVCESEAMKFVLNLADRIKNTESNVLITGETGVGKGILARYIHETSNRKDKPLVHINCGAIPHALLESELFGYESGAFTGADKRGKPGLIEISHGGTLFLDEISELPFLLQVKILDFIQRKRIMRVGGTKEIEVDCRLISASNKHLEEEIKAGSFRSDLFYRLNVVPIDIPPLRERKADIVPMANYFLELYMNKYHKNTVLSNETWDKIKNNRWEGNIRELENYIERIVVTNEAVSEAPAQYLEKASSVGAELEAGAALGAAPVAGQSSEALEAPEAEDGIEELAEALTQMEKKLVCKAWEKHRSSYKVAEILGVSQSTAYRKIKKYCPHS